MTTRNQSGGFSYQLELLKFGRNRGIGQFLAKSRSMCYAFFPSPDRSGRARRRKREGDEER
jgi:hypothetical protein